MMEECREESTILGMTMISVHCKVGIPKARNLTVKWWGDGGETMSESKYQDVD